MRNKLFNSAIITSPIIAIYGASPFYIFTDISFSLFLLVILGLTLSVFLMWMVHIYFALKFPNQHIFWRFIFTYIINVGTRLLLFTVIPMSHFIEVQYAEKYIAYPIITSLVLNALIIYFLNSIVTQHKKLIAEQKIQTLELENTIAQKQILMQQLQPHFLFNTLSTLKSLIGDSQEKADEYVLKLSDFLRYSVQSNQKDLVSLEEEIQFVRDYIQLQKMRFDKAFNYSINIPNENLQYQIPVLALQILVENIFKHNYFTEKNPLHFSIELIEGVIVVQNNKVSVRLTEKSNTGLNNLNKRCQLILNKSIEVIETEELFTVKIPVQKQ